MMSLEEKEKRLKEIEVEMTKLMEQIKIDLAKCRKRPLPEDDSDRIRLYTNNRKLKEITKERMKLLGDVIMGRRSQEDLPPPAHWKPLEAPRELIQDGQ